MVIRTRILAAIVAVALLPASIAYAQGNSNQGNSKPVLVTSATVDRKNDTVSLKGLNLGGRKAIVYCEIYQMTVLSATEEELLVSFPASSLDGTFLFTLIKGNSANDRAYFYVTTSTPQIIEGKEGPMGPQGPAGPAGPQGPKGDTGAQGLQGPKGDKGDTGAQGPQGLQGLKGDKGDTGAAGAAGATGPQGPQGEVGPQGPQGPKGDTGLQGPQGLKGDTGLQGLQGLKGDKGDQGLPGLNGVNGVNGVSGYERVTVDSGTFSLGAGATTMSLLTATCPAGKKAIAGGYEAVSLSAPSLTAYTSFQADNGTSSWKVGFRNGTSSPLANLQVKVFAICVFAQ